MKFKFRKWHIWTAMGIAVVSSLLTVIGIKNFVISASNEPSATPGVFEKVLGQVGVIETPQATR